MSSTFLVYKQLGETPLEALERFRSERVMADEEGKAFASLPLTYAGRLDPMAEGLLLILVGEECKQKDKYLSLDKVYEADILLGVSTDTHDLLGLVSTNRSKHIISKEKIVIELNKFLGRRSQTYPAFSSKTHSGQSLFVLARSGDLPNVDEMPKREVEIYQINLLDETSVTADYLEKEIFRRVALVKGDFRQKEIIKHWQDFFTENQEATLQIFSLRIHCSSGTYIRALAHELGQVLGTGALAFSIKRTQVGAQTLDDLAS